MTTTPLCERLTTLEIATRIADLTDEYATVTLTDGEERIGRIVAVRLHAATVCITLNQFGRETHINLARIHDITAFGT